MFHVLFDYRMSIAREKTSSPDEKSDLPVNIVVSAPEFDVLRACHVLAVDDDPIALRALESHLNRAGCCVTTATSGRDGLDIVNEKISVALLNLRMPGMDGLECLRRLKERHPHISVIILTAASNVESAVEAMREGAFQYVTKPFAPKNLVVNIAKAFEASELARENNQLRDVLSHSEMPTQWNESRSDYGQEFLHTVQKIAPLDSTVFIGGESGTGKSTIARLIHQSGPRAKAPFVTVNCASLPRDLIESELFGHAKGSFTGAINDRIGKAEVANKGTLFLDEIGDLPIELQPKLLTFLQDRVIQRLGCNIERPLDVRLIVATHRNLAHMCEERRFRQDLYYRLNVLSLDLAPLRERRNAIGPLAMKIVESLCRRTRRPLVQLNRDTLESLCRYDWPGNIRELENVLERAIAFSEAGEISPTDIVFPKSTTHSSGETVPATSIESSNGAFVGMTLEEIETRAILANLKHCDGNKAKTARVLGISEKSIYNKMKRLKIDYSTARGRG